MRKFPWIIFLLFTLASHSCFVKRQVPSEPRIPVMDPVRITLDSANVLTAFNDDEDHGLSDTACLDSLLYLPGTDTLESSAAEDQIAGLNRIVKADYDTICIIGTGDLMPGTNYPDDRYLPPGNNFSRLFEPVAEILKSADITFGNLEGVFCSEGGTPKECKNPDVCYVFRMPDEALASIVGAGFNLLSVANNHVNDFGHEGRESTARLLEEAGVPFAGFINRPTVTFVKDSVKYGFAAFAPHIGTLNLKNYSRAAEIVSGLDSTCDIVIVSFHGGAEGKDYQHLPCTDEEFLGYNRGNVCTFAHTVVDAGADVVFGHGPHVTRAMELYKERLICYSLGNFCTYARFNLSGPNGVAPLIKVYTDTTGKFLGGEVISVKQEGEGGPRIDEQGEALHLLRLLTETDLPDSGLVIQEDGILLAR